MTTTLITGANRGIGLELTRQYAALGHDVIACCRNPEAATDLKAIDGIDIHPLDVTDDASVKALASVLEGRPIDVLINNAGIMSESQSLDRMDYEGWSSSFEVNAISPFRVSTVLLPNIRAGNNPCIINITSLMGSLAGTSTGAYAYRSSKAAANKVSQVLAQELKGDRITVCPMHPGWVQTDMGGSAAPVTAEESAAGLIRVIAGLTLEESGRFFQYDGEELPW